MKNITINAFIASLVIFGYFSDYASANCNVRLVTFEIPGYIESNGKGKLIDLLKYIEIQSGCNFTLSYLPPLRAQMYLKEGKADAIFPFARDEFESQLLISNPILSKKDIIFYRKNRQFKSLEELDGKIVGLTLGYPYSPKVLSNKRIKYEYARTDFDNLQKLNIGRIDATIIEEKTGMIALKKLGLNNIVAAIDAPIDSINIYFAFRREKAKELEIIDKQIINPKFRVHIDKALEKSSE